MQFTQTKITNKSSGQTASQLLMAGYVNHYDSTLYNAPRFLQAGEVWYAGSDDDIISNDNNETNSIDDYDIQRPDAPELQNTIEFNWEIPHDVIGTSINSPDDASITSSTALLFHNWEDDEDDTDDVNSIANSTSTSNMPPLVLRTYPEDSGTFQNEDSS